MTCWLVCVDCWPHWFDWWLCWPLMNEAILLSSGVVRDWFAHLCIILSDCFFDHFVSVYRACFCVCFFKHFFLVGGWVGGPTCLCTVCVYVCACVRAQYYSFIYSFIYVFLHLYGFMFVVLICVYSFIYHYEWFPSMFCADLMHFIFSVVLELKCSGVCWYLHSTCCWVGLFSQKLLNCVSLAKMWQTHVEKHAKWPNLKVCRGILILMINDSPAVSQISFAIKILTCSWGIVVGLFEPLSIYMPIDRQIYRYTHTLAQTQRDRHAHSHMDRHTHQDIQTDRHTRMHTHTH